MTALDNVLTETLRHLQVDGSIYFCNRLECPWAIAFDCDELYWFHYVLEGRCDARVGDQAFTLETGDLLFLHGGERHSLRHTEACDALMLCGHFGFSTPFLRHYDRTTLRQHYDNHTPQRESVESTRPVLIDSRAIAGPCD